jgi:NAD-dependent SIR2 family protein deacetylase
MKMSLKKAWFFGAGASISYGIPLTKQFIPWLFENKLENERLLRLKTFIQDFFPESVACNIYPKFEQVLSFLDIAIAEDHYLSATYHHKYLRQLRSDLDYLIWRMLEQASTLNSYEVFDEFVNQINPDNSLFLSLNYDTLLDHSILRRFKNINYGIGFSKVYSERELDFNTKSPLFLKLHGSINWLYCPDCQSFYSYLGNSNIKKIFDKKPETCDYDDCYLKGIMISPTWLKNYNHSTISLMWIKASKILRDIHEITFVGYSLSDIDMQVLYLLKRSLFNNKNNPLIKVVDPDSSGRIAMRYQRIFGNVKHLQMTFEEYVKSNKL